MSGTVKRFDQSIYTDPRDPSPLSLGDTGYVFVPKDCDDGAPCRVHIALHGCLQDAGEIDRRFIDETGYNAWADTNRLIVLYPQTAVSWYLPYNPLACWDLWGYVDQNDSYVTKSGSQIRTIKAMLDALTARAMPRRRSGAGTGAAPTALTVVDTSDTVSGSGVGAAAGAAAYRIWRAGADGQFAAVADTASPGFADSEPEPAIRLSLARHGRRQRSRRPALRRGRPPPRGPLRPLARMQAIARPTSDRRFAQANERREFLPTRFLQRTGIRSKTL